MDVLTTYNVFLVKTLKEKKYYWARNVFFLFFPLLFITIFTFSGTTTSSTGHYSNTLRPYVPVGEVSAKVSNKSLPAYTQFNLFCL